MPEKLPVLFSVAFDSPIWEMQTSGNLLLISTRNDEQVEVAYTLMDSNSGAVLWQDLVFEEPWWIGVAHFYENMAVFHTYSGSREFEPKSIFGFDVNTKEVVWAIEDYLVKEVGGDQLWLTKKGQDHTALSAIDIQTGKISDVDETETADLKKMQSRIPNRQNSPFHYREGTGAFETVSKYLSIKLDVQVTGALDYLENDQVVVISYFEQTEQTMSNSLVVFNQMGETIHREVLSSELTGLASDTFFILDEALIFVRNKSQLVGLSIKN